MRVPEQDACATLIAQVKRNMASCLTLERCYKQPCESSVHGPVQVTSRRASWVVWMQTNSSCICSGGSNVMIFMMLSTLKWHDSMPNTNINFKMCRLCSLWPLCRDQPSQPHDSCKLRAHRLLANHRQVDVFQACLEPA